MMGRMAKGSGLVMVLALFASGCAGTVCDDAVNKLVDECDFGSASALELQDGSGECEGDSACAADCVLESDCEDIIDKDKDSNYYDCLADCLD